MRATLFAEAQERAAVDLVADIAGGSWTRAGTPSRTGSKSTMIAAAGVCSALSALACPVGPEQ